MTTEAAVEIRVEESRFRGPAAPGVEYYRLSIAPRDVDAVIARLAIIHGYGDHGGRYAEAMAYLAARGVACHAVDLRGHGRSSGRRGYVRRWDEYLDDLQAFLGQSDVKPAPGRPPLFVLGHSHGGLIVAAAGIRGLLSWPGVAGCILDAPYFVNAHPIPRHKALAARVLNVVAPWTRVRSGIRPEMTSGDPAMIEESRRDPLMLRSATPRWYLTHQRVQREAFESAGEFRLPLLVLQGDADSIADPRGATRFHAGAGSTDKTLITYPGFRHEPLRESGRARVFADVYAWIAARASKIV